MNNLGFTVECYVGMDGTPVVHINTEGMPEDSNGPICRVYLNDGEIFENPPWPAKDPNEKE